MSTWRNVSSSTRCSTALVFASFRAKQNLSSWDICQIPPSNFTTVKQGHLSETTYWWICLPTQKSQKLVSCFVVLHFVMLLFFLCFWFCASFVFFRGGCLLFNAVILVAHISAAKYKVEVSAFRVHCLGLCFFVLPTHRTLTSYAKPKMMHNALISLSAFAWIVRRRSCLCSVGFGALLNSTSFKSSYSMSMSIALTSARFLAYPSRILITNTIMHPWSLQRKIKSKLGSSSRGSAKWWTREKENKGN